MAALTCRIIIVRRQVVVIISANIIRRIRCMVCDLRRYRPVGARKTLRHIIVVLSAVGITLVMAPGAPVAGICDR